MSSSAATCQPHQSTAKTMSETASLTARPQKTQTSLSMGPMTETPSPQPPLVYPQSPGNPEVGSSPKGYETSKSIPLPPPKLLSTYLVKHPNHTVGKAIRTNFPQPNPLLRLIRRFRVKHSIIDGLTEKEMRKYEERGEELRRKAGWKFEGEEGEGTVVSQLFWKMYISLLPTLDRDPLSGLVPPDLLGSTTTMPLSIISLIPDIMQHYRDVIIRARTEVFLATNYWQPSNSVNTVSQALRDLSAQVLKDGRPKVVVKIMYDRGSWEQLWNAHAPVHHSDWTPLDLPAKEDVKGLDMEVIVLLGTFHAKFLIVDRKVALINSNNIQDRPNLELMSHFEGPVVDAFYEIALHSWYNRLSPPLPCMTKPYEPPRGPNGKAHYLFQDQNPYFDDIEILKAAKAARILLRRQTKDNEAEAVHHEGPGERLREAVRKVVDQQRQSLADWKPGEEFEARAQTAMKELREFKDRWSLGMGSRVNSRGPSRRPSKEKYHDEEKRRTLLAPSEADSSPTMTAEHPPKSKTYPLPNDRAGDVENSCILDDGIPSKNTNESDVISRHSLDGRHANEEKGLCKHHVCFAPLEMKGVDGMGKIFPEAGMTESPNTSTIHLPLGRNQGVSSNRSLIEPDSETVAPQTGSHPQNRPIPEEDVTCINRLGDRTIERKSDIAATKPGVPAALESQTVEPPTSEGNEGLPLSAQTPKESGETYERTKKHVEMAISQGESAEKLKEEEIQPEGTGSKRMFQLSKKFNAGALSDAWATVEDSDELDNFRPHVVHAPHDPFPIAMCCRKPHGYIRNPQNAAWLAGFRYAKKKVFVQTPTLNARPIVRAVKQACRRGVEVVLLLDLGFNDKGESIPFQGGTNEEVVDRLYKKLSSEKKEQYLKVYWYTGKDQVRPLNAVKKQRNCHIKFAAYDDEVVIIGNGNQDSQSWFHSQEVNVMIDSKQIVAEMMDILLSNQNTIKYGLVDSDGIWRDKDGHTLEHYGATAKGAFRGLSAFITFAKSI
ncbi:hypothetical protein I305_03418 [Cryptococcus gattii E566]|uniref:PLD phosphodiesterase domain-containing protein n=1 Tax=Cryptococcus gattii EJB2 TaxID=1296103 RepID=A0ABR5BZG7_9TREE|nr:hypothetical protein I306_01901 [Cryptococcus gattii EJB2]KIY34067.1 hypothetical protein I305_03418 [Cryptococcus gattii E566]